jgi:hypothetical protein
MMCLGNLGWSAAGSLSHNFLCLTFPPPLGIGVSPPHSLRNLAYVPGAELGEAGCQDS